MTASAVAEIRAIAVPHDVAARVAACSTVAEVKALLAEATETRKTARKTDDVDRLRGAVELRARAERRGGEIAPRMRPPDLSKAQARRWRALADMNPAAFEAYIRRCAGQAAVECHGGVACASIKMIVSPWHVGADGTRTRCAVRADDAGLIDLPSLPTIAADAKMAGLTG